MKKLLTLLVSLLFVFPLAVIAQNATATGTKAAATANRKRGPVFRATKGQINQAQVILKARGFYSGEQTGKLEDATRDGLKQFQKAEGLKVTGTLNKLTLEKMGIELTDKQKAM
jgi:peptidoglycan hydrolase-like protein with peptidoglycan-binding domain